MRMKRGFSLIELLVVIAIIAILAGIAFPVFARSKDAAYRNADMAKMNELRTAIQLYRNDQGGYPPALLGYATGYLGDGVTPDGNTLPSSSNIVPADQAISALFPKRVNSLATFQPAYDRIGSNPNIAFTSAVWPDGQGGTGAAGVSTQRYGSDTVATRCVNGESAPRYFYKISGFDAAEVPVGTNKRTELRYTLFWTGWTVPADPCTPGVGETGSGTDDPRQLGYSDPPDTTVVTWDSYFRELDAAGAPTNDKRDIVLFLGGSAKMMSSRTMSQQAWAVKP